MVERAQALPDRRPGLGALCAAIQLQRPKWSTARVVRAAKTQYDQARAEQSAPRRPGTEGRP